MELLQLRYFMLVAEQQNITKAATIAFTSQSNISKRISQLEEELETQLLRRRNVGVELTPAGECLYAGIQKIMLQLDSLIDKVKGESSVSNVIRLGLTDSMDIERVIPQLISRIAERIPNLEVRLETQPFDKILEKLALHILDIGFVFSVMTLDLPNARKLILNRRNPLIYFSKKHRLFHKEDLCPEDFLNETFVISLDKRAWYNNFEVLPFVPRKVIETNSLNAIFSYVESGTGVTVLGQNQSHLGKQNIATLEIPTDTLKVGVDAIWIDQPENPVINGFITELEEILKEQRLQNEVFSTVTL